MINKTQIAIARQILSLGGQLSPRLAQMFVDEVESLQHQNKRAATAFETIHGIASETFESPNQLELIRLTASDTLLSLQDKPL